MLAARHGDDNDDSCVIAVKLFLPPFSQRPCGASI